MSCPAVSSPVGRPSHPAAFRLSAERVSPVREIGKLETHVVFGGLDPGRLMCKRRITKKPWIISIWWQHDTFRISDLWNYVTYALRGGGRRTQCPSGGHTPASATAPLSQQLRDLEDEVETKHFVRSKSGVRLTEPGRTFLKAGRSILAQS
jgi:hypothetical protein